MLVFPFPGRGMVNCMLKLADLLSGAGLLVTFLNTHHNHRRLSHFSGAHSRLAQRPKFRFASIPDGLSEEETRSVFNFIDLEESMRTRAAASFRDLLIAYRDKDPNGWPPVTCVIADGLMPFTIDVSEELGIPAIMFRTISACCVWAFLCIPELLENGEIPFPGTNRTNSSIPVKGTKYILIGAMEQRVRIWTGRCEECRGWKASCGGEIFRAVAGWPENRWTGTFR